MRKPALSEQPRQSGTSQTQHQDRRCCQVDLGLLISYKKYNTTGILIQAWADEHEEEIANCFKSHPELDYRKIHGKKYDSFTWNIFYFLEQKVKQEKAE